MRQYALATSLELSRRDLIVGAAATSAILPLHAAGVAPNTVAGTVFHDRGRSGARQAGNPGIPGVLVSNGVDVVATGSDGRWQLREIPGEPIFVIKPSDWSTPVRDDGLPLFAKTLSAGQRGDIDFALRPSTEPKRFEVALLADTQPQTLREVDYLRDSIMESVTASGAAFAINHGDIVFDTPELYPRYLELLAASGMTWHHCPGNHDMDHATDPSRCFDTWRRVFGPCRFAFQFGDATFISLNNVEPLPRGQLTPAGYGYRGGIGRQQLAFVRNILALVPPDRLVVISMHVPLVGFEDPLEPSGMTHDCRELMALLSGRPHTLSLAGHTHTTEHHYLGREHGFSGPGVHHHHVLTAACGSWWSGPQDARGLPVSDSRDGTPKGYHMLSVDADSYTTRFVPVGHIGNPQVRISVDGTSPEPESATGAAVSLDMLSATLSAGQLKNASIAINVFDGGPRTTVTCRLESRDSVAILLPAQRQAIADPYIAQVFCRHKSEMKSWVEPAISSHIWRVALPDTLPPGAYRIAASIQDEYRRLSSTAAHLEIVA